MSFPSNLQSGSHWCAFFPTSQSTSDLSPIFRGNVERFLNALNRAGAYVVISATLRPRNRALLMHMSWRVANGLITPQEATQRCANGVVVANQSTVIPINWVHNDPEGEYSEAASLQAAREMKNNYRLVHQPSLNSIHMEGNAIDMNISWSGTLTIVNATGQTVEIASFPRDGSNEMLHNVGRGYGVIKLASDPPHWSENGR